MQAVDNERGVHVGSYTHLRGRGIADGEVCGIIEVTILS
jgi:hypothetical protein